MPDGCGGYMIDGPVLTEMDRPQGLGINEPQFNSDAIALTLRDIGLPYIALVPGASYRGLHDSLVNFLGNTQPQMLVCLHEEHAVAIAHGYAKATGKMMGAALHSNVGLMHAAMAIYNAWCDRVPVLVLGAHGPVDAARRRPWIDWIHTTGDAGSIVRNYVKWDNTALSGPSAVEAVLRASQIAATAPFGPVYVCLDMAMQEEPLPAGYGLPRTSLYQPPDPAEPARAALHEAASLLKGAKSPVILAGRIARTDAAWAARIALAERLNAPVLSDTRAGATFPTDHPLYAGAPQHFVTPQGRALLRAADVVLSLDWVDLGGTMAAVPGAQAKIIHASCDSVMHNGWSMDHQVLAPADVNLFCVAERAVEGLLEALGPTSGTGSTRPWIPDSATVQVVAAAPGFVAYRDIADELAKALDGQKISLTRLPIGWPGDAWPLRHPLDFLGSDGGAGIGSGPGIAVGAALGLKGTGRLAVAILGDGDYLMGVNAFWTAARYQLPLLVLVANNRSFLNDELHQERVALARGRPPENRWIGQRLDEPAPIWRVSHRRSIWRVSARCARQPNWRWR